MLIPSLSLRLHLFCVSSRFVSICIRSARAIRSFAFAFAFAFRRARLRRQSKMCVCECVFDYAVLYSIYPYTYIVCIIVLLLFYYCYLCTAGNNNNNNKKTTTTTTTTAAATTKQTACRVTESDEKKTEKGDRLDEPIHSD